MRTLMLNASFEPLTVVGSQRAVQLFLKGKAEILEQDDDDPQRSERQSIPRPTVIRLTHYAEVPFRKRAPLTRRSLLARDNYECCYCTERKGNSVDHVQPRSRKGENDWMNVVAACNKCNAFKDNRTPEEALLDPRAKEIGFGPMRFQPWVPETSDALRVVIGTVDEEWEAYLSVAA